MRIRKMLNMVKTSMEIRLQGKNQIRTRKMLNMEKTS